MKFPRFRTLLLLAGAILVIVSIWKIGDNQVVTEEGKNADLQKRLRVFTDLSYGSKTEKYRIVSGATKLPFSQMKFVIVQSRNDKLFRAIVSSQRKTSVNEEVLGTGFRYRQSEMGHMSDLIYVQD